MFRSKLIAAAAAVAIGLTTATSYADQSSQAQSQQQTLSTAWVRTYAMQAATYGMPIVAMYNLRSTVAFGPNSKIGPNQIWRVENIATPAIAAKLGYVTPNVNVIYGFGFMDLGQQPLILKAPNSHGRYYMVEIVDMWTNAFAYVGGVATGYGGGTYALVGPGWHGTLPAGVKRIDSPTRWVEIQPRVHVKNEADVPAAQNVLRAITVEGLAEYEGRTAPPKPAYDYATPHISPNVASNMMQFTDPVQFWEIFSAAMNENPPSKSEIRAALPQFRYLGIKLGTQWKPSDVTPAILEQMKYAAAHIGPMLIASMPVVGSFSNGWVFPTPDTGKANSDYVARAIVAAIGLTSNTPEEALYFPATLDNAGQPLTGAKRYTITFKEPMLYLKPVSPGFWSLTMYDALTNYTVENSIHRYALGSDDDIKRNADGSFTLYVQHDKPSADKLSNWLPAPAGPFYLTLRTYASNPHVVTQLSDPATFQGPPPIVATGE
jgi:hypothetical protein